MKENGEDEDSDFGQGNSVKETRSDLSVAQIIVTCATPCVEDAEKKFEVDVSSEENGSGENDLPEVDQKPYKASKSEVNQKESQVELKEQCEDDGFGGNHFETNFEANFEANFEDAFVDTSEADKKESPSEMPKQVVGGRASIPEELDSHQLARLQNLKESNA